MTICAEAALKIRQLEAELARLHQALDDFGRHCQYCDSRLRPQKKCNCGLDAARAKWRLEP